MFRRCHEAMVFAAVDASLRENPAIQHVRSLAVEEQLFLSTGCSSQAWLSCLDALRRRPFVGLAVVAVSPITRDLRSARVRGSTRWPEPGTTPRPSPCRWGPGRPPTAKTAGRGPP